MDESERSSNPDVTDATGSSRVYILQIQVFWRLRNGESFERVFVVGVQKTWSIVWRVLARD